MTVTITLSEIEAAALEVILSDNAACSRALRSKASESPYAYSLKEEVPSLTVDILLEQVSFAIAASPTIAYKVR